MRHSGVKPQRQPRSLRSIVEQKSDASNFPQGDEGQASLVGGTYEDPAAKLGQPSGQPTAGPQPIGKRG